MSRFVPKGYTEVNVAVGSSNVNRVTLLVCKACGTFVGSPTAHNEWHAGRWTDGTETAVGSEGSGTA